MPEKILFICGSLNQTTMMHKISQHLPEYDCYYTPFYADGLIGKLARMGWLDFTILGGTHKQNTENYLAEHDLKVDFSGLMHDYHAVVTCTDTLIQKNIRGKRVILVQEGMMDLEGIRYQIVKNLKLPRYLADTATTGLSDVYDLFCVASNGYREMFIKKGVKPEKTIVTGIPNFDNVESYKDNDFPHRDYVLVATSAARETFKPDNRVAFIKQAVEKAAGRPMIFKLHPNEKKKRAIREIRRHAPGALIYEEGNTNHMIANCEALITQYSSVTFVGLALGKEVYSNLDLDKLREILPLQNGGRSAKKIADLCRQVFNTPLVELKTGRFRAQPSPGWY